MVDIHDTKFSKQSPEQPRKGLDNTDPIVSRFNQSEDLLKELAQSSPRAQELASHQFKIEEGRLATENSKQERSNEFRVLREKDRAMQKYFSEPSPIPNDPAAKKLVYQTIHNQAVRSVAEREQYYQDQIKIQTEASIREIVKMDREGRLHEIDPQHSQDHNNEHERGDR